MDRGGFHRRYDQPYRNNYGHRERGGNSQSTQFQGRRNHQNPREQNNFPLQNGQPHPYGGDTNQQQYPGRSYNATPPVIPALPPKYDYTQPSSSASTSRYNQASSSSASMYNNQYDRPQDKPNPPSSPNNYNREGRDHRRSNGSGHRRQKGRTSPNKRKRTEEDEAEKAKQRNFQEEAAIKKKRQQMNALAQLKAAMDNKKDQLARRSLWNDDSDEEEGEYSGCTFVEKSQEREWKLSSPRRQPTSSPLPSTSSPPPSSTPFEIPDEPLLREAWYRFQNPTRHMRIFADKENDFPNFSSDREAAEIINIPEREIMHFERQFTYHHYHPNCHSVSSARNPAWFIVNTNGFMENEDSEKKIVELSEIEADYDPPGEYPRIFEAVFNERRYENSFRCVEMETDGFIPISKDSGNFEELHEIMERREQKHRDRNDLVALKAAALREGTPTAEGILNARLIIQRNPKLPKAYLDYCKAEDTLYQRHYSQNPTTTIRDSYTKRKLEALTLGINKCEETTDLCIEKGKILLEQSLHTGAVFFNEVIIHRKRSIRLQDTCLDCLLQNGRSYDVGIISNVFRIIRDIRKAELLKVVRSDSRKKLEKEIENLWMRQICWFIESGKIPQAMVSIQASAEFSFFFYDNSTDNFARHWNSGASRLNDSDFERKTPADRIDFGKVYATEEKEILEEIKKEQTAIRHIFKKKLDGDKTVALMEEACDNAYWRPLRIEQKSWNRKKANDQIFLKHIERRHYIAFKGILLHKFTSSPIEVSARFGFELWNADFVETLRHKDSLMDILPQGAQRALLNICARLVALEKDNSLGYSLAKNAVNYSVKHYKADKMLQKAMDITYELFGAVGLQAEEEDSLVYYICSLMVEKDVADAAHLASKVAGYCEQWTASEDSKWLQLCLGYLVLYSEFMDNFIDVLSVWTAKILGDDGQTYNLKEIVETLENIIRNVPPNGNWQNSTTAEIVPSIHSLAFSLLIKCFASRKASKYLQDVDHVFQTYKDIFCSGDRRGQEEVHFAILKHYQRKGPNHSETKFWKEVEIHLNEYSLNERLIKIVADYLKPTSQLPSFAYRRHLNPIEEFIKSRLDSYHPAYMRLTLFDRDKNCNEGENSLRVDAEKVWSRMLVEEARTHKVTSKHWKLAIEKANSNKLQVYHEAIMKHPYSKAIHLQMLKNEGYKEGTIPFPKGKTPLRKMAKYKIVLHAGAEGMIKEVPEPAREEEMEGLSESWSGVKNIRRSF